MKNIIICMSLVLFSCKEKKSNTILNSKQDKIETPTIMENKLPYTSDDVKPYYKIDSDNYVVNTDSQKLINFNSEDILLPIKENDFNIKQKAEDKYAIVETFNFSNNISGKLIIYNTYGENDSKILNVVLNSYKQGKLVDQLLLDCRFTFEIQYYRTFRINKDETVELVKYSINNLEYNENGDIVGEKKNADIDKEKLLYKIDNEGKFLKK